jgi:hypothetical protein
VEPCRLGGRSRKRVFDAVEEEEYGSLDKFVLMGARRSIGRMSRLPCKAFRTMAAAANLTSSTPLRSRPSPSRSFLCSGSRCLLEKACARLPVDLVTILVSAELEKLGRERNSWVDRRADSGKVGLVDEEGEVVVMVEVAVGE